MKTILFLAALWLALAAVASWPTFGPLFAIAAAACAGAWLAPLPRK